MGRLDVIENYVKTGGVNGGKYTMDRLYQRANSFIRMVTNREDFQHMQTIMKSDKLGNFRTQHFALKLNHKVDEHFGNEVR